jgi:hypothetical protein
VDELIRKDTARREGTILDRLGAALG